MSNSEREVAINTQEKFEFYVLSLVFTLLALSIQTSKFGVFPMADTFELLGWLSLLVSGIAGLWRLEYVPDERIKRVQKEEFESKILDLKKLQMKGVNEPFVLDTNSSQAIPDRIRNFQEAVDALGPLIENRERSNLRKYHTHRYLFVIRSGLSVGITFLRASNKPCAYCFWGLSCHITNKDRLCE